MQWIGGRRSGNIEDRRGMGVGRMAVGGGLGGVVLLLISLFFGVNPGDIINTGGYDSTEPALAETDVNDETKEFVSAVVGYTEDTWSAIFSEGGATYRPPKVVLYTQAVESACGFGQAAMGPFYCPGDEKVYLDLSFFQELRDRFRAPGDFAQAYVIAHEVGHHVQHQLNLTGRVNSNRDSVKVELQADCLAGVWAHRTEQAQQAQARSFLDPGDLEEALQAASMIGDDKLQMRSQGYVVPESFTHGSAEQRMRSFKQGFSSGTVGACNTFK
jgi:predicted metalloprotease